MSSNSKKNILITGANGLLGYALQQMLCATSYRVYAVTRDDSASRLAGVDYLEIDFSNPWSESSLPDSIDVIIHLAQSSKFRDFPEHALDVFRVNVDATARLLDYAHRSQVQNFIFASSGGIYGSGSHAFKENSPITPVDHLGYYLSSKMCGEMLAQSYAKLFDVKIVRPFFMYGERQNRDMLIPRLVDTIKSNNKITLQGDGGIRINPIHVSDAALALTALVEVKSSMTINIGGPEVMSLREICDCIPKRRRHIPGSPLPDRPQPHPGWN